LNIISHNSAIKLLRRALSQGFIIKNVYVDTVGDALKYQKYIKERVTEY
jgi:ribonuclease H2 subunit A